MNDQNINTEKGCIVWRFNDAPVKYRELSKHGGDEDWVIFMPASIAMDYLSDMNYLIDRLTISDCEEHVVNGGIIYITAHT